MMLAAVVTAFSLMGEAVSTGANAQGIAVPPEGTLVIPDNPCMTPGERRSLQKLSDEHDLLYARLVNVLVEADQLREELQPHFRAKELIEKVEKKKEALETSDEVREYEHARETIKQLEPVAKRLSKLSVVRLSKELARVSNEFDAILAEIDKRECPALPPWGAIPDNPNQKKMSGPYGGPELVKNWGRVRSTESVADSHEITHQFSDSGDPLGAGIVLGYNFRPWNNNLVVGPFASFDYLNQTINHTFAAGTFLGTTTRWIMDIGAKGGVVVNPGLYLYGLAGAAWLNQKLNVNFATAASSNTTTPGLTLGIGAEYHPASWSLFGNPVSVFLQYQHTWWDTANFNTPASSPGFNYAFRRDDDTVKLGVNIYLSAPSPAPTRALITK
jgi:hypothetical protein